MGDILFLAHRTPYPPDRGDRIRAFHVLKALARRAPVHLVAFADDDDAGQGVPGPLAALVASTAIVPRRRPMWRAALAALAAGRPLSVAAFDDPGLRAAVDRVLTTRPIDKIWVFSSQMAQYVPADTRRRFVMDFCDVDAAKFAQYGRAGSGPKALMMRREGRVLLEHDRRVAARADTSLFVSPAEAALFERLTGAPRVAVLPNGIDTNFFDPVASFAPVAGAGQPLIVFTGQMDYAPNIEAAAWFAQDILPRVRAARPDARFAIVGRAPTKAVERLAELPGVKVTGAVPDVRGWLAVADVVVAPLKLARGVQNKVLEAMAMARPVVASTGAAQGIAHGDTIRVAADTNGMAAAVAGLFDDPAAAAALGAAARARVVANYGWDAALAPIDGLLTGTLVDGRGSARGIATAIPPLAEDVG